MAENKNDETTNGKILNKLFEIIGGIFALFIIYSLWNNYSQEKFFYKEIYQQAETALRRDFENMSDLEIDEYDRDRITELGVTICDLGEGNLRYQVYNVSVHATYYNGSYKISPDIKVYYYDNSQVTAEGVDPSVPSHYHASGVLENFRNAYNEAERRGYEAIDKWKQKMTE